jgi:uncharacterized protein (TIRG00374 family)
MKIWINDISANTLFLLIFFNLSAFYIMGVRWFFLIKLKNGSISFFKLTISRLIGFAWSYITPGSQMGGEIFQAEYASSNILAMRSSAVTLFQDRVLEFLGNFILILYIIFYYFTGYSGFSIIVFITSLLSILIIFKSGFPDVDPESLLLKLSFLILKKRVKTYSLFKKIKKLKIPILRWPKSNLLRFLLLLSVWISPVIALFELIIFFNLTGVSLNFLEALILLSIIKISFYIPVPGAIGFFEAGVILSCSLLNIPEQAGLGFIMYTRIRDFIQVVAGLILSIHYKSGKLN